MGRDCLEPADLHREICFNPRARMGRDVKISQGPQPLKVSIHAPAWGATCYLALCFRVVCFNPRARMGRDSANLSEAQHLLSFNPRARMGRDDFRSSVTAASESFNPRARMGRDKIARLLVRRLR